MTDKISINGAVEGQDLHFVLVPLMAQGHMIPMVDLAHLLAARGVVVSFITTPVNAARIRPAIDGAKSSGLPIRFVELKFPSSDVGLPDGCENLDLMPQNATLTDQLGFFRATELLRRPLETYIREHQPYPSCMITDLCHPWTRHIARDLSIPRLTFFSICCFSLLCNHNIYHYKVYDKIKDETEQFEVPGLPSEKILVNKAQAPGFFNMPGWETMDSEVRAGEREADGIVVNTFDALEPLFVQSYAEAMGKKVWALGPFSLRYEKISDMAGRGNRASVDVNRCLSWLNKMSPRSVVYASFGSITFTHYSQLVEIGQGLEAAGSPFIWVIKESDRTSEIEKWLAEEFEETVREKGLVIRGWAPQAAILSHTAVGAFVTHCGWNSTLEGIVAGVPIITWPYFFDQFLNERFVVDVIKIGVSVGVSSPNYGRGVEIPDILYATKEDLEGAVRKAMDGGEEGEERRKRATEFSQKAKEAMREGGSSYENLTDLIHGFSNNC